MIKCNIEQEKNILNDLKLYTFLHVSPFFVFYTQKLKFYFKNLSNHKVLF